jgi:hypothetical protein
MTTCCYSLRPYCLEPDQVFRVGAHDGSSDAVMPAVARSSRRQTGHF